MKKLLPLVCLAIAIVAVMIFVSAPKQPPQFPAPPEPPVIKADVDLVELIKPSYLFTIRDLWSISDEELALQSQVVTALQHTMITAPKSQVSEGGYRLCTHLRKIIDTHYTYRKRQQQNAKLNRTLEGAAEIVGKVNNDRRVFAERMQSNAFFENTIMKESEAAMKQSKTLAMSEYTSLLRMPAQTPDKTKYPLMRQSAQAVQTLRTQIGYVLHRQSQAIIDAAP